MSELVARREAARLSQAELARLVGVGRQTIARYESGEVEGSPGVWRKIEKVLVRQTPSLRNLNPVEERARAAPRLGPREAGQIAGSEEHSGFTVLESAIDVEDALAVPEVEGFRDKRGESRSRGAYPKGFQSRQGLTARQKGKRRK